MAQENLRCDFLWPFSAPKSRAAKRGGFKRGGFPIWTCPSFFVLFCPFGTFPGIFPICSGMVWGFSRFVLFLFLGLLRAPTRNSPERVRDTIWTFPEKSGKHPGLETPRFSFSQPKSLALLVFKKKLEKVVTVDFKKHCTAGWEKVQGSVDPRFSFLLGTGR